MTTVTTKDYSCTCQLKPSQAAITSSGVSLFWLTSIPAVLLLVLFLLQEISIPDDLKNRSVTIYDQAKVEKDKREKAKAKAEAEAEKKKKPITYYDDDSTGKTHEKFTDLTVDLEADSSTTDGESDSTNNNDNDILFEDEQIVIFAKQQQHQHQKHSAAAAAAEAAAERQTPSSPESTNSAAQHLRSTAALKLTYECNPNTIRSNFSRRDFILFVLSTAIHLVQLYVVHLETQGFMHLVQQRTITRHLALWAFLVPSVITVSSATLLSRRFATVGKYCCAFESEAVRRFLVSMSNFMFGVGIGWVGVSFWHVLVVVVC